MAIIDLEPGPARFAILVVYFGIAWIIRVGMVPVLLRRQLTPGASIAWLGIIFLHPYIGLGLYMLVGESRLGVGRTARYRELVDHFRGPRTFSSERPAACAMLGPACGPIVLQARKTSRMPVLEGNQVEFIHDSVEMIDRLTADIASATSHVHLLYYILAPDASGMKVAGALKEAVKRGVKCRLLVDSFASRIIFRRGGLAAELRRAGIEVAAALPYIPLRRRDQRDHRKLAVIDDRIGYCGSQNLINADYGGRRGNPWYDLTGRFTGPVVGELAVVFAEDWAFETDQLLEARWKEDVPPADNTMAMQVVPTGPAFPGESFRRVLLGAIQTANQSLILTTPYFVPDDPTLISLLMAADRGVEVTLVVPATPDHRVTAMAGRAHFAALLEAGVRIYQFRPGLLHSKTVTVDDSLAILGSANLDVRSFNLNFELGVLLYGPEVTRQLREIQMKYVADSTLVDPAAWMQRSTIIKYAERALSLLSPIL